VRHWSSLPGDVQADIYQHALYVQDKNTVQLSEELARLIEKHKLPPPLHVTLELPDPRWALGHSQ
jgi:hypothetical protein